jgi:hypothetical protein
MIAFTTRVVQFSPWQKLYSGCSESSNLGVIHVTGGRRSSAMSSTTWSTGKMCFCHLSGSVR